jgi:adenylate cyclase
VGPKERISVAGRSKQTGQAFAEPLLTDAMERKTYGRGGLHHDLSLPAFEGLALAIARVEYTTPDGKVQARRLKQRTAVGRHTDNDIQLLDPEVSKAHLVIEHTPQGIFLNDLGSANGTLVNGTVVSSCRLGDGDFIIVGNTTLRFYLEPDEAPPPPVDGLPSQQRTRSDPERTMVTLVPDRASQESTNVFALPMDEDFQPVASVNDESVLRRDYERLRVAFDLACSVGVQPDLFRLGETILERILGVLPADTAVIMLRDPQGELSTLASFASDEKEEVRIPRAIIDQVVGQRDGLLTSDALLDAALRSSHTVVGQRIRSALCVPLLVGEEVVGVIHLSSSHAAGAYEERDLSLMRAIAQPAALAVANARLMRRIEEEAKTRAQLGRFLSPALIERVVRRDISLETSGDKVLATVLFGDIRGFTALSDGQNPEAVVSMLNEYFEAMVEVVFQHGGTLDKFLGDGLMAVWGTPVRAPDDAVQAVRAAHEMREVLDDTVNLARAARGEAPLKTGYGIATGMVIAGAMGGRRRQDFTVIGDVVNLASRLCGEARPGQILVSESTWLASAKAGLPFVSLDARMVKGVARPVPVFELNRDPLPRSRP